MSYRSNNQAGADGPEGPSAPLGMLRQMLRIRAFEEGLLRLPRPGFQLLSQGEEGVAVGACAALTPEDTLLSSGRSIGPALARGIEPRRLMAELLGKAAGPCRGRAGRGHVAEPATGFFGAHAVVGENLAVAAGVALAAQMARQPRVVMCIFGDGACGAGSLHETLNLAALWRLPLVLLCNNNQYSASTPVHGALAPPRLSALASPFGIPAATIDGMDALQVRDSCHEMIERAREGGGPSFLECISYRFATHSTSSRETRPLEEQQRWQARCPIQLLSERLLADQTLDAATLAQFRQDAEDLANDAARFASEAPYPDPEEGADDVG